MGWRWLSQSQAQQLCRLRFPQPRKFSTTVTTASGHNRWSKIRHDKGKEDALKSKARTILSQEIILASKYGGSDPALNSRLVIAIANAKRGQLSKTSIESAIVKGQGRSPSGVALENVTIEAMLPFGVAAMIECLTESKARTLQDVRHVITRHGGTVTPTAFLFEKKGRIWFRNQDQRSADDILEDAIDAGALEVDSTEDGQLLIETDPSDVTSVGQQIQTKLQLPIERLEVVYVAKEDQRVVLDDKQGEQLQGILDLIEEEPSLQNIYINAVPQ